MKLLLVLNLLIFSFAIHAKTLIGKALLEYSIFKIDVYEASYYKGDDSLEELHLDYKRDVIRKHSIAGWEKGFEPIIKKDPSMKDKLQWVMDKTIDYDKGDLVILQRKGEQVKILRNDKIIAETKDAVVASYLFAPWIGEEPIDDDIKEKLLGKK